MNFTEREKAFIKNTESNISYFNASHKGKLEVEYYVDNGNVARIKKNGKIVLDLIPIEAAFYAIAGIIRYMEVK